MTDNERAVLIVAFIEDEPLTPVETVKAIRAASIQFESEWGIEPYSITDAVVLADKAVEEGYLEKIKGLLWSEGSEAYIKRTFYRRVKEQNDV